MKTYAEIEEQLWEKIDKLPETQKDFVLFIGYEDGEFVDLLYFGLRKLFEKTLVIAINDTKDELTAMDSFTIDLNKEYREHYKEELRYFVLQFGLVSGNYYEIADTLG